MNAKKQKGYKLTEAGVIPDDWMAVALGNLGTWKGGATPSMKNASFWENGTIPWVSSGDVKRTVLWDAAMKITKRAIEESSTTLLPAESLLFVTRSGILRKYLPVARNGRPLAINQDIKALIPRSHHAGFLLHLFLWSGPKILGTCLKSGTTVESIDFHWLKEFVVPLPSDGTEQVAIADVLSTTDTLIARLEELVAKKKNIKHGAMRELLTGKRRLPGFSGEWEKKELGELADMGSGGTPLSSVATYYGGDIPWVSIADMTKGGRVILSTDTHLTQAGYSNSAAQMFPVGTVLYAMYASLGECSIAGVPLSTSQAILGIRTKKDLNKDFLYFYLTSIKRYVKSLGQQGTQANLNKGMVQRFELRVPPPTEQVAIAAILSDMDTEIERMERELAKYRELKQGMMQLLLTGKIRLI